MNQRRLTLGGEIRRWAFPAFFLGLIYGVYGWRMWAIDALDGVIVVGLLTLYRVIVRLRCM